MKLCWSKTLQTLSSLHGIPNLHLIGEEIRDSDRYHWTWTDRTPSEVFSIQYTLNGIGTLLFNGRKYIVPPEHCFILQLSKPETTYYLDKAVYNQWHLFYLNFLPSDPNFINSMNEQFGPIHYLPKNAACIKKLMQLENHKADHITPHLGITMRKNRAPIIIKANSAYGNQ